MNEQQVRRTGLAEAILRVIEALGQHGPMNVSQLSEITGLNWKTADKVLGLLYEVHEKLKGKEISEIDAGSSKVYSLANEYELDKIPTRLRSKIIRKEFPEPTEERRVLVTLLLKGASCSSMAITVEKDKVIDILRGKGRVELRGCKVSVL
jgi:hypothetical protein